MAGTAASLGIEHVFVLMLENRSFDHLLGFSDIGGTDAGTGAPTKTDRLAGTEANTFNGQSYPVTEGADARMPTDPHHEFTDILVQLCGAGAQYPKAGPYPAVNNSGFVYSYVTDSGGQNPAELMKCYSPKQLPVLNALANEFVICDNWHASLPGPTWPNRLFVHAASSGGLDHSPTTEEIVEWETLCGFPLPNGSIFDSLKRSNVSYRLYAGDLFPMVAALKGIHLTDIRQFSLFRTDLQQPSYPYNYIFIEPSYDVLNDYRNGTSQHPLADVNAGEGLIKATYEAIRASAVWPKSLLIVTWDENGGFFDHAIPPDAPAPGDTTPNSKYNQANFTFEKYGPRVVGLAISPLIPRNLVDHRVYDHASIPATLESLFGLPALTARDAKANRLDALITLQQPRDTPATLPAPAVLAAAPLSGAAAAPSAAAGVSRPNATVNDGNLPSIVGSAMQEDIAMHPEQRDAIVARVASIRTRADAQHYLSEVEAQTRLYPSASSGRQ